MLKKQVCSVAALALALALVGAGTIHASEEKDKPDKKKEAPGLEVGVKAPAFKLKDQNEKDVELSGLLKKGPVALVFFRSASW